MIRISVKGNREETEKVLKDRRIDATFISALTRECCYDVDERYQSQIVEWHFENSIEDCVPFQGYPIGTLLYHN